MSIEVNARANVDEVFLEGTTSANGTIDLQIPRRTTDYPLHIVFCIDRSGSMGQSMSAGGLFGAVAEQLTGGSDKPKMEIAKKGLKGAIDQLSGRDTFGVVSFSNGATKEVRPTSGGSTRDAKRTVDQLSPSGGTSIDAGLRSSRQMLNRMSNEEAVEWIVLISDGKGSVPTNRDLERHYSEEGIVIQAAGVGDGYDRQQMLDLAQRTQGELEDVGSGRALARFFSDEVQNARNVAALGAELSIQPSSIVSINEVYYSLAEQTSTIDPEWRHGNCVVDLGDVNQQNPPQVVFEMEIDPTEVDLEAQLVRAVLDTNENRASDDITVVVDRQTTGIKPDDGGDDDSTAARPEPTPDPDFILKKISTLSQEGKLDEARRYLEENEKHLPPAKYSEAQDLIDEGDVSGLGKL
jgi:hypothetical protein